MTAMRMYSNAFNTVRELEAFVNDRGIQKKDIVEILSSKDGLFILTYYAE